MSKLTGSNSNKINTITFPRAFAFAIDDLGWNEGSNLTENIPPGPVRAAVKRSFDLNDYRHVVTVGKAVGTRGAVFVHFK